MCKAIQDLMADSREQGRAEGREEEREEGLRLFVKTLREFQVKEEEIVARIMKEFSLSEDIAKRYL